MSSPARRAIHRLLTPVQAFLRIEAASGAVLIAATAVAIAVASSTRGAAWQAVWLRPIGGEPVRFWIDDGLMTAFFFVVGIEIRRERADGMLATARQALLPVIAAAGGMAAPALIYLAINHGRAGASGWGVPMATDIAFAVGVLALLGSRVPAGLRVLLLALAVIDDLGAILVIAIAYSVGVDPVGLAIAGAGVVALVVTRRLGLRASWAYVPATTAVWLGLHRAGIEPALAGVIAGVVIPPRAVGGPLHALVAFGVMPLFALANAGISVGAVELTGDAFRVFLGVVAARVIGKPIGIAAAAWLARATRAATWSEGHTGRGVVLVGLVGGIGFTVPLFVSQLVFAAGPLREAAVLGLLIGSGVSAVIGLGYGAIALERERPPPQKPSTRIHGPDVYGND